MNFALFHLQNSRELDIEFRLLDLSNDVHAEIKGAWDKGSYLKVLEKEVEPPSDVSQFLERAFGATNTIDTLWTDRFTPEQLPNGPQQRSTSVGDIIHLGKNYYLCMTCGWKRISL